MGELLGGAGAWLAAGLILFLPGWSVLVWLPRRPDQRSDPIAFLADGAALSISILGLLALWMSLAGIQLGSAAVIGLFALALAAFTAGLYRRRTVRAKPEDFAWSAAGWAVALALLAGVVVWRLYQARTLPLPAWVDSVHHVLIVRKILEFGGLPPDLTPYIPAPFFYHYGFHLAAAVFTFVSGLIPAQAVLWFGQVMNALVAFSVYRAAVSMQEDDAHPSTAGSPAKRVLPNLVALVSAVLVAFAFQMPAYYVTWGRYTLLAGLVLLGPCIAAGKEAARSPKDRGVGLRLALLTAGLCITHYFALLLFGLFMIVLGTAMLFKAVRQADQRSALLRLVGWCALGLLAALPWIWQVWQATQSGAKVEVVSPIGQSDPAWQGAITYLRYIFYLIGPLHSQILLALSAFGLAAALWQPGLRVLAVWSVLLVLLSLPWGPRFGPFRPDHYAIVLFFPAAILLANLIVRGAGLLAGLMQPGGVESAWLTPAVTLIVLVVLAVWGMRMTRFVINEGTILVDQNDRQALDWVNANIPEEARFYINTVRWQGASFRGVDGGYWLMPYTGRASLLPPVLYFYAPKETFDQINRWAEQAEKTKTCDAQFWELVDEARLTHVYVHAGKGALQPDGLAGCERLREVYQQDNVLIYEIEPPPAQ